MKKIFLPMVVTAICLIAAAAQNARAQNAAGQGTAQSVQAQNHEPPAVMGIIREAVKEGHTAAHEKVEADWAGAMRKHNFPYHDLALTSMTGPSEALFLLAFKSFAEVEEAGKESQKPALKSEIDLLEARDGELRSTSRTIDVNSMYPSVVVAVVLYINSATFAELPGGGSNGCRYTPWARF